MSVWHPISAVMLREPRSLLSPLMLKMLIHERPTLIYCGDAMWPTLSPMEEVKVQPLEPPIKIGQVVIFESKGIVEIGRAERVDPSFILLKLDSDPEQHFKVPPESVIGQVANVNDRQVTDEQRRRHRFNLDCCERRNEPEFEEDSWEISATVRKKYDALSKFYAGGAKAVLPDTTLQWVQASIPANSNLLIVGSGAGREAVQFAKLGYKVVGVDFSKSMTQFAKQYAKQEQVEVVFECEDICDLPNSWHKFNGVFFTYDVYSFIPGSATRMACLEKLPIESDATLFLSARVVHEHKVRRSLKWQYEFKRRQGRATELGDSHTRYLSEDGTIGRSYVHHFEKQDLIEEANAAGWNYHGSQSGHFKFSRK